jgi:hypothetical protein
MVGVCVGTGVERVWLGLVVDSAFQALEGGQTALVALGAG